MPFIDRPRAVIIPEANVQAAVSEDVQFTCRSLTDAASAIWRRKDGLAFLDNVGFTGINNATIIITNSTLNNTGDFICTLTNSAGNDSATATLQVIG